MPAPSTWVHLPLATVAQQMRKCIPSPIGSPVRANLPDVLQRDQREREELLLSREIEEGAQKLRQRQRAAPSSVVSQAVPFTAELTAEKVPLVSHQSAL